MIVQDQFTIMTCKRKSQAERISLMLQMRKYFHHLSKFRVYDLITEALLMQVRSRVPIICQTVAL